MWRENQHEQIHYLRPNKTNVSKEGNLLLNSTVEQSLSSPLLLFHVSMQSCSVIHVYLLLLPALCIRLSVRLQQGSGWFSFLYT